LFASDWLSKAISALEEELAAEEAGAADGEEPPAEGESAGGDEPALTIHPALVPPVIDGEVDAVWQAAPARTLDVLASGERDDLDDLSAQVQALYDVDHLYVLFQVADDLARNDSTLSFQDDAVEVYVDGLCERASFYDGNDVQYVFGRGDERFWVTDELNERHPGVAFRSVEVEGGYRVEIAVPWINLGAEASPDARIGIEFHVDDDDDGREADGALAWHRVGESWSDPSLFAVARLGSALSEAPSSSGPREAGVAQRVYAIGRAIDSLPKLVPGQTPNVSRVMPAIDWEGSADFGGLEDNFTVEVSGTLLAPEEGTYAFRLESDDGSRLWIDNQTVIDHDGLHSPEAKDGSVGLSSGEHALRIDFFESIGGQTLRLFWQPPGEDQFELVPPEVLSTQAGEVRVTSPGNKRIVLPDAPVRPGDQYPLAGVHPSFDLHSIRPSDFRPRVGGLAFLPDGRLLVAAWEPEGGIYALSGVETLDPERIRVKRIAAGLAEPLGLEVVDGKIFVLQKQELTQLIDRDGDQQIDEYRTVAAGWGVTANFHEFAFGLLHHGGVFLAGLATAIDPGGASTQPQNQDRGKVIAIRPDGSYEFLAHGLRTPNGIGLGVGGEVFLSDNQGDWLPSSKIVQLIPGAFYGNRSVDPEQAVHWTETPPVCWLPQNEIGNSPSEIVALVEGPYAGQMAYGDVTQGGLQRVFAEKVGDAYQGVVFRFTQGLEAGVNRVCRGPDGALYVGGIGSTGNWGQDGKKRYGLERLSYNGAPTFEMLAVRSRANGMEIEFTEPLSEGTGWNKDDYEVLQWRYEPTAEYGGPKLDEEELTLLSASVSSDARSVFAEIEGLKPGHVVYLRLIGPWVSAGGRQLWSTEAWYTLNAIADVRGEVLPSPVALPNTLSAEEEAQGFRLIFDGSTLAGWRGFRRPDVPSAWRVEEGALHLDRSTGEGGDLLFDEELGDFELRLSWKIAEGGNSGIIYRADEAHAAPWESGPEMQVLDDASHRDRESKKTSAGSNYALHEPALDVVRAAGLWNDARILVQGDRVEHWLNGHKIVEYTLRSEDWEEKVAASKFADMPDYGRAERGYIVLQDHGDRVWYRSIRLRRP
jgi:cytochrome c